MVRLGDELLRTGGLDRGVCPVSVSTGITDCVTAPGMSNALGNTEFLVAVTASFAPVALGIPDAS